MENKDQLKKLRDAIYNLPIEHQKMEELMQLTYDLEKQHREEVENLKRRLDEANK